jgi:hypothetical protein
MSYHLNSPIGRQDARVDITDLYAFRRETGAASLAKFRHSIVGKFPTPEHHPQGRYEFEIDATGDDAVDSRATATALLDGAAGAAAMVRIRACRRIPAKL